MKRSLAFKWSLTLLLSSLTGVILVGLFAYRTTLTEFDRLRIEQAKSSFLSELTIYYNQNSSWDGLVDWLRETRARAGQEFGRPPLQMFALANSDGKIVVGDGPFQEGQQASTVQLNDGIPVKVGEQRIGTVLLGSPPGLDPGEILYLYRTNQALIVGAIGAIGVALLVGFILSRQFLRPLSELTTAIGAMKQGSLNQRVAVRTRDELGQLAEAFNQMSAEMHRANQLRQQMTADVAHDLRTPLMVINGYLEGLCDGTLQATPAQFETMRNEATLLQRLIEDLRTLSLADSGELKLILAPAEPSELLEQVRQSFEPIAEQQQVTLHVQIDEAIPALPIDFERMVQVLSNLVSNALRYTSEGGSVTLAAHKFEDRVQLIVSDTGTGIPADELPNIFERFYRIDESRHEQGESGLGLAIAKSIVEAHHGTIKAESQVGTGTSITITLQLANLPVAAI